MSRWWTYAVAGGAGLAIAGLANTWRNLRILRTAPPLEATTADQRVSVLLPLRNEAARVTACLESLAQQDFDELIVLDDASTDGTAEVVVDVLGEDPRLVLLTGTEEPPRGWLGKPWACQRLADAASGDVLVFLDADVVLDPGAVQRTVSLLLTDDLSIICPYPRQVVHGTLGRLVQPLLQWSWLTTLVLDRAEVSANPATAAGNGQLLATLAVDYRSVGGHGSVRSEVLEDVALVRQYKSNGMFGGMADGTDIAECTMYTCDAELIDGYTKSLWSAFGSPAGAAGALTGLTAAYVMPAVAMVIGPTARVRLIGFVGYAAAVLGRLAVARRTDQRTMPDCAAQPVSILAFTWLVVESFRRRHRGELSWRGRPVAVGPADSEPAG